MTRKRGKKAASGVKTFTDYKAEGYNWITLATGEYYPDILPLACELYKPVLVMFGQLIKTSESSQRLFSQINDVTDGWMRVQLMRIFRQGPERAGKDILMGSVFPDYPNPARPVDFVIYEIDGRAALAIGLARYDSDRGGAQEDDRTGDIAAPSTRSSAMCIAAG